MNKKCSHKWEPAGYREIRGTKTGTVVEVCRKCGETRTGPKAV